MYDLAGGNHARPGTAPALSRDGEFGHITVWDGATSSRMLLADVANNDFASGTWTTSSWFRSSSETLYKTLFEFDDTASGRQFCILRLNDTNTDRMQVRFRGDTSGPGDANNSTNWVEANDGNWHLVTLVRETTTKYTWYADGRWLSSTITNDTGTATFDIVAIGALYPDAQLGFEGDLGSFMVWDRPLSAGEVWQLYAPQTRWELYEPIPRTFPVLLPEVTPTVTGAVRTYTRKPRYRQDQQFSRPFRLNKNSPQAGGLLAWFATNRNTGSPHVLFDMVNNFVVSQATAAQQPTFTRDSNFGSTISFDGSDKLTSTSNFVTGIGSGNFTWACWVYPISAPGTWDGIMGIHTDSRPGLYVRTASTNWGTWFTSLQIDSGNVLSAGQWYHLAFLRRGTTIYFYENGLQTPSTGTTSNSITDTALTLGASSTGTEYGNIRLADVRVYNRALSPGEIWQLYDPQTRWQLYEPIPRLFPVVVGDVAPPAQVIGPFPTHFRI
jgi:hypothetical protein